MDQPSIREQKWYEWEEFSKFALANYISLDSQDDWGPWWACWKAGYDCSFGGPPRWDEEEETE